MTIKNNAVKNLYFGIRDGLKKGWPNEADNFSTIVLFLFNKWETENFPERIQFRFSELAQDLIMDTENAAYVLSRFRDKVNIWIRYRSKYAFEIIGDPACPDEIKKVPIKDEEECLCDCGLFSSLSISNWDDINKDGEAIIAISYSDELRESVRDEDLSILQIELFTPNIFDGNDMLEWLETGKTIYSKNAGEPGIKVTVKYEEDC